MKSLKIFFLAALVAFAGLFTACTEDGNWSAGENEKGMRVFFSSENATSLTVSNEAASFSVDLARSETVGALEVGVTATFEFAEDAALFTIPSTVVFADGAVTAPLTVGYDYAQLTGGASYKVTFRLTDESMNSTYGYSEQTVTIVVPEPYVLLGTGLWREDLITGIFTSVEPTEYEVEVYENTNYPGYLFLKNVYTSLFPYNEPGDYVEGDYYLIINVVDPNDAYLPTQELGLDWGYGMISVGTVTGGTLKDGILTFPAKAFYLAMANYNSGNWSFYGNPNGLLRLVMPGVDLKDYSMTVAYGGMSVEADNTTVSAVLNGTYGADVASMRYAFFDGDVTAAAAQAAEIIIAAAEEEVGVKQFTQGLDEKERVFSILESKLAAPGVYTVFCVPYSADGEPQASQTATVSFYYPGVGGAEAPECEFAAYFYYVEDLLPSYASSYPATEYLMWLVEGVDIKSVNLAGFFTTAAVDNIVAANMANGLTEAEIYEVLVEEYGELLPDEYLAELSEYGYTFDVIKIGAPDVAVTYICTATNIYGSTKTVRCDGKTASATATAATSKGAGVLKPEFNPQFSGIFRMKEIK